MMNAVATMAYAGHGPVSPMRELTAPEIDLVAGAWGWSDFFQHVSSATVGAATAYGVANAFGPAGTTTWAGVVIGTAVGAAASYVTYNTWESIENSTPEQQLAVFSAVGVPLTPYQAIENWASHLLS